MKGNRLSALATIVAMLFIISSYFMDDEPSKTQYWIMLSSIAVMVLALINLFFFSKKEEDLES